MTPWKLKLLSILPLTLLAACGGAEQDASSLDGLFTTKYVGEAFLLHDAAPSAARILTYATAHAKNNGNGELPFIKDNLPLVADCFGIDRAVFTGLVRQESAFDRTQVSSGGAIGWTQFTTIGLQEVKDQLGERGPAEARAAATKYFTDVINDCVVPQAGLSVWKDAWKEVPTGSSDIKELNKLPLHQLVYGAILLKTYLSNWRTKSEAGTEMKEIYRMALEAYNGEELAKRQAYAKNILGFSSEIVGP